MSAENMTSPPEATENANVSGVIDKNDTNVSSDAGYAMSLSLYDNLGYQYTAKFAIKSLDSDAGTFSVELTNIYDDDNRDILKSYLALDANNKISDIFGANMDAVRAFDLTSNYSFDATNKTISFTEGSTVWSAKNGQEVKTDTDGTHYILFTDNNNNEKKVTLNKLYGVSESTISASKVTKLEVSTTDGSLQMSYATEAYTLQFSTADGTFSYVGTDTSKLSSQMLNMSKLGDAFADIDVDFTGTEVATDIKATLGTTSNVPDGAVLTMTVAGNDYDYTVAGNKATFALPNNGEKFTSENGVKRVTLTLTWENSDTAARIASDTAAGEAAKTVEVPITITAQQHITTTP